MKQSKAKGRVSLATDRLAAELPLHAGILAQWRIVEDTSIGTMAIGYNRGRLTLYFSPHFVESISLEELSAVLSHEANHVLFGHCEREPVANENKRAMVIAEETTVNEWVSGPLPGDPIVLANYPALPPNEDTLTRYDRLLTILPEAKDTLDDHSRWEQIRASGVLGNSVIATAIARVWDQMTPEQKAKVNLPEKAKKIVEQAVRSAGASVLSSGTSQVPWQKVLRRYVGQAMNRRPVFTKPSRRFPDLVGILPGRGRSGSKPRILAAIDTSGSMTASILSDISAELSVMAKTHEVIVVECDNKIRDVYPFRPIGVVHGRGGTDFRPVFQSDFLRQHKPDLVVYFTDGCGSAPIEPPHMPVIWVLTGGGKKPASWGKELRIC